MLLPKGFTEPAGSLQVRLLQGNIPQDEKYDGQRGIPLALRWYGEALLLSPAELTLAPEMAVPLLPKDLPPSYWDALRGAPGPGARMIGVPQGDEERGYTNSVLAWTPQQTLPIANAGGAADASSKSLASVSVEKSKPADPSKAGDAATPSKTAVVETATTATTAQPADAPLWRYDKHHLVPFGEFTPPWFKWFTRMMNNPLGDFERGALGQASFSWRGQRIGANICYEDLFSEELAVRFSAPELAPTILANISNLAWFGDTVAMEQHLHISRMRALEFERPVLRATNTGVSAIIDHLGRVTARLTPGVAGVLDGVVEGRTGLTPYASWVARFGLWPLWLAALCVVACAAWQTRMG